ncbi:MAG: hypothetical protein WD512_18385, partial [Candidatus Paceibacterota bacterium]
EAVSSFLCTYCTIDWQYKIYEKENEIRVKMTMIKKHNFPEHMCNNTLAPCGHSIKYYKETID